MKKNEILPCKVKKLVEKEILFEKWRKKMKKILVALIAISIMLMTATAVSAVKPAGNLASAEKVPWSLSADVMPVPPYGLRDIAGSDTASKLIVNQPNGNVEVVVTGDMNGLNPDTVYTVYLSNQYALNVKRWDVTGIWVITVNDGTYPHDYTFTMTSLSDGTFTGVGGYPAGSDPYTYDEIVINGQITGDTISFTATYYNPATGLPTGYSWTATGTIDASGNLVAGTGTSGVYEWHSTFGSATYTMIGSGWPGLFTSTIPSFTFTTDGDGAGSWHLNLRDSDFSNGGTHTLSVWINEAGGTMLISDNFPVEVD